MKLNVKHLWLHLFILISNSFEFIKKHFTEIFIYRPIRRFIHVDDENLTTIKSMISRTTQRSSQSSYTTDDMRKMSLDYPELVNFMTNITRDKKDNGNNICRSRLYKAKAIQNDFR
jgi:hypothetical protein